MTIRVRAYNTKSKQMFSPEEMAADQMTILPTGQFINVHSGSTRLSVIYPLDVMVPMLSSGRTDKNGTEIFVGDILDDGGIIEFRDDLNWDSGGSVHSGFFSTKGYEYKDGGCLSYHYQISEHEVIGNIYENPNLLTPESKQSNDL